MNAILNWIRQPTTIMGLAVTASGIAACFTAGAAIGLPVLVGGLVSAGLPQSDSAAMQAALEELVQILSHRPPPSV